MTKNTSNHMQSLQIPKPILQFSTIISSISSKLSIRSTAELLATLVKRKTLKDNWKSTGKSIQQLIDNSSKDKKILLCQ